MKKMISEPRSSENLAMPSAPSFPSMSQDPLLQRLATCADMMIREFANVAADREGTHSLTATTRYSLFIAYD
jgi:hypothetical protein